MKKSLLSLAFGTFALGIVEFGMMGILSEIAADLRISVDQAGHLISAYSAGVAVGAPGLIFLRKLPLRRLMLLLAAIIAIGNALVAVSPNYWCLLGSRFIAGLPHGAFFGAGAIVCARLADAGKGASAVAILVGGMTVANLVGVPVFTFLCNMVSWRVPFALVACVGMLTFFAIHRWTPVMQPIPDTGLKGQFRFLRHIEPWLIYAGVFFGQAGVYCWLSYISPIMTRVTGFPLDAMSLIMILVGAGMVVGNWAAGKLADRFQPSLVCAIIALLIVVVMPLVYFLTPFRIPSLVLAFVAPALLSVWVDRCNILLWGTPKVARCSAVPESRFPSMCRTPWLPLLAAPPSITVSGWLRRRWSECRSRLSEPSPCSSFITERRK